MIQPNQETVTLTIDGREVTVPKGTTLIEAARQIGIEIPHYCYDRDLSIVASCRLCLVEIEKVPKLQPSCSTPAADGQIVSTQSEKVLEARKMQMEFLLVQHPLDCPVCDQGGECKLQDYSRKHGMEDTRFHYRRRTFPKPDIGPFIDLERNRCILCSRCVRYMSEVAGDAELSIVQRGWKSHIATFQNRPLRNEFAGNIIDLCPVGALTSKVTRFRTRVWEMKSKPSICTLCSVGCSVQYQHRNRTREILRVIPRFHPEINGRWICDVGRFGFDQFNSSQRLHQPRIKNETGEWRDVSWPEALGKCVQNLKEILFNRDSQAVAGIIGSQCSNETLFLFQQFFREVLLSNNIDSRTGHTIVQNDDGFLTSIAIRAVNRPFQEIRRADTILLLGSDLPNELPILNLQVQGRAKHGAAVYSAHSRPTRLDTICRETWVYNPGSETVFLALLLRETAEQKETGLSQEIEELVSSVLENADEKQSGIAREQIRRLSQAVSHSSNVTILLGESIFASPQYGPTHVCLAGELAHLFTQDPSQPLPLSLLLPQANTRGAADLGCLPHREPGYQPVRAPGRNTTQILEGCVDGTIQALILFSSDLIEEYPERDLALRALETVPFLIIADAYPTTSTAYAQVLLPLSVRTEEDGTYTTVEGRVQRSEMVVAQLEGALAGYQVLLALGERWGAGWRQVHPTQIFDMITQAVPHYSEMSWDQLASFGGMTGSVDLSLFPSAMTLSTLNQWTGSNPPAQYPYRLVRGRYLFDTAGEKRFASPLVDRSEPCRAEIHPEDAKKLCIADNVEVTLKGSLGSIRLPVRISESTPSGFVTILGGYENSKVNSLAAENSPWVTLQP